METLMMVVGEPKYVSLEKILSVGNKKWDFKDLNTYCVSNYIDYFTIDDYCDLVNGGYSGESSIDVSNMYVQHCYVNI